MQVDKALLVALGAFAGGMLVAWLTTLLPTLMASSPTEPSPSPSPSVTATDSVILPPMSTITRQLDKADAEAGVTTTDVTVRGEGTFTIQPGQGVANESGNPVRWVSISFEDGVEVDRTAATAFIVAALNDVRGWEGQQRVQFVQSEGVADYRIMVASPYTAAALCPDNHVAADVGPVTEASPSPQAEVAAMVQSASSEETPAGELNPACAKDGVVVISMYDWTAGYGPFGVDRTASRQYLVNHQLGHLFGLEESVCVTNRAAVMDNQRDTLAPECEVNPWPNPDAVVTPAAPTPAP